MEAGHVGRRQNLLVRSDDDGKSVDQTGRDSLVEGVCFMISRVTQGREG